MAIVTAPVVGPPLGGWITDNWTWRWIFFINIPIGIISLILTRRLVSDPPEFTSEVETARKGGKLKIDGLGIVLVALGFACLEVVLDRGQTEDWFESHFIVFFFPWRWSRLVVAAIWEWRHPDPVVEIRLLEERNFRDRECLLFSVWIYAVWVDGANSADAAKPLRLHRDGCGAGAGAGRNRDCALAPLMVRILPKVGVKPMISVGYVIFAMAMWRYASFDLGTDYRHMALARALQGLGIAPLFVPVSQLAYSFLPKNKNNKASSLTNLFRNQGGSVGIAFVTTVLARRTQYHQSILVEHASPSQERYRQTFNAMSHYFRAHGFSTADAALHAKAQLAQIVGQQAAFLGFLDCFWLLGCACLIGAPLVFFTRKFKSGGPGGAH